MGHVKIHDLFRYLLDGVATEPEVFLGLSNAAAPRLGDFLDALDPNQPLDWNGVDFQGLPSLRSSALSQAGLAENLGPENVLITAGAAEANYLIFRQLLSPGDRVVLERPGWPQAEVLASAIGCQIVWVDRDPDANWDLPLDRLAAAITDDTRLVFLTNPNNPTGRLIPEADLRAISALTDRVGAHLVVDEVYAGLEWRGERPPSVAGLVERGVTTGSVSKALGLQGLRTGWLITQDKDLIRDALILRENSSEIMNIMGEVIADIALQPDRLNRALDRTRTDAVAGLNKIAEAALSLPQIEWAPPDAGLIGLARLRTGQTGHEVAQDLLGAPYRTFLIPGNAYHQPEFIRLGVGGGPEARLEDGLERLGSYLGSLAVN